MAFITFGFRSHCPSEFYHHLKMTFKINTHDSWGIVNVGNYQSMEEARQVFTSICEDPWYKSDGTVKGVDLVEINGVSERLDYFAFR